MKKTVWIIVMVLLGVLTWYLFLKPYDYLVTIETNTFPGAVNQTIKLWGKTQDDSHILEQKNLTGIKQQLSFNDSTYVYDWHIDRITDSTSRIKVYVKDVAHSFQNKITIPFANTDFEKRTKKTLVDFTEKLNEHIANFKVSVIGSSEFPPAYCLYVPITSTQLQKASGMMKNYGILTDFIMRNNIKSKGPPFIETINWDVHKDSVRYNFCFPIIKNDSLPAHKLLKYKQYHGTKGLKAIYNGNYITSDRAWYALIDYAKKNNIEIEKKPVEVFYNNPNFGGDELSWKTEVYMPLK